jgi:hypothetical protein
VEGALKEAAARIGHSPIDTHAESSH